MKGKIINFLSGNMYFAASFLTDKSVSRFFLVAIGVVFFALAIMQWQREERGYHG